MTQVLVIDDSFTLRQLIRATLEPLGYGIIEASDGEQGLDALRSSVEPLVVLLDYQMPIKDGMEVLQTVNQTGGPLLSHDYIVISANHATFPSAFIDLLRNLSIRVLPKPFERETLLATVGQAAERLASPPEGVFPRDPETTDTH